MGLVPGSLRWKRGSCPVCPLDLRQGCGFDERGHLPGTLEGGYAVRGGRLILDGKGRVRPDPLLSIGP